MSPPRVLVLGAQGMLGQMLRRVLPESGAAEVVGTARRAEDGLLAFDAEADDPAALLRRAGPVALVVNAIAVLTAELREGGEAARARARAVNAAFPHRLAEATAGAGAHLVLISSDAVFRPDRGLCVESTPPDADDPYGASKRRGEVLGARHVVNLRCTLVGPDPRRGRGLLEWVLRSPPGTALPGFTDQRWRGLTTRELAGLCGRLAEPERFRSLRAESPVHHVCPHPAVSKAELLQLLVDAFRPDLRVEPAPSGSPVSRELASDLAGVPELLGRELALQAALAELRDREPPEAWQREPRPAA